MAPTLDLVSDSFDNTSDATSAEAGKGAVKLDTDGTLAANSDTRVATQKAVKTLVAAAVGMATTTDGTLAANSDTLVPTEKAVKTYADTKVPKHTQAITGALTTVADAPAKAVLTSIISALVAAGLATDGTS